MFPRLPESVNHAAPRDVPKYGKGFLDFEPGAWRKYLFEDVEPVDALIELARVLFVEDVDPRTLTLEEVTEGVRRALTAIHPTVWLENVRFVSEEQCRSLAEALLTDAKLPIVHGSSSDKPARVLLEPLGPLQVAYDTLPVIKGLLVTQSLFGKAVLNSVGIVSKYTSTPHGTYHYFDSRPEEPDAPPVVLLHGMFTTSVSMGLLAPFIAQHRRVILPDMLEFDYGWSRSHSGEPLSWVGHIAALVEFIRGFGHGPLDIVGHSYGGWVAARMCRDYPDVVRRVVLLAPGGLGRYRSLASARLLVSKEAMRHELAKVLPKPLVPLVTRAYRSFALGSSNLLMLRSMTFAEYFERVPIHHESLLIWGTDDDLHVPWGKPHIADAHMMRDIHNGSGVWVIGGSHSLILNSMLTLADLCIPFLRARDGENTGANTNAKLAGLCKTLEFVLAGTRRETRPMSNAPIDSLTRIRSKL